MIPSVVTRVLRLLTRRERRQLYWLAPSVVILALLEVVGIASITPVLALLGDPRALREPGLLNDVFTALAFQDEFAFLMFLGGASLFALVVSNGFGAYMTWRLKRFAETSGQSIAVRLMRGYLGQPYAFFLNRNSADLVRNLMNEVPLVVNGILMPGLELLSRSTAVVFVTVLVFSVDPVLALLAGTVFGSLYAVVFGVTRRTLQRLGAVRLEANRLRFRVGNEAFGALKDVKLMGLEGSYLERFTRGVRKLAHANTMGHVIAATPRYLLETLAFGGVLAMVITMLGMGRGLDTILPVIGLYAFAVYRLMPALQTVFASLTTIRYNLPALDVIGSDLPTETASPTTNDQSPLPDANEPPLPFNDAIELRHVSFKYPNAGRPTLHDIDLSIPINTMVGFVGTTGSGKTTVVDLLLGLLAPSEGGLYVDGDLVDERTVRHWQKNVGYVPQHIYLADDTVAANIALGVPPDEIDRRAVETAAHLAMIHDFVASELPDNYDTVVGERGIRLSGGQRQRIGIARALYRDPKVLVFDEATSALDNATERGVFEAILGLRGQKTIILVAHRLTTVQACHEVVMVEAGRVTAKGTYESLLEHSGRFREFAGQGRSRAT